MLNEELFDDEKDKEIARLKHLIDKFKKYDKERKEFYSKKLQRLGELEAYIYELEAEGGIGRLNDTIKSLKGRIKKLEGYIRLHKIDCSKTDEEVYDATLISNLKSRNKALSDMVKNLRKTNEDLIMRLNNK